jgi:hypothetical protein
MHQRRADNATRDAARRRFDVCESHRRDIRARAVCHDSISSEELSAASVAKSRNQASAVNRNRNHSSCNLHDVIHITE